MSKDLRSLYLLLPLRYDEIDVVAPGKCEIRSSSGGLSRTIDVRINSGKVPWRLRSDTRIECDIDPEWDRASISEVEVWGEQVVSDIPQVVKFEIGDRPQQIEGIEKLVQQFVMLLFKDPGTDVFNPTSGGGLLALSKSFMTSDASVALGEINTAVKKVVRQLRRSQMGRYLPSEERLVSAELVRVDTQGTTLHAFIRITSAAARLTVGVGV